MSDLNQSLLHDPKYGSVRQFCRALGYASAGSKRRKSPRSVSLLRSITGKFRKQFVDHFLVPERFPLDYQSSEVQQCVSQFLTEHARLFEDSDQAREFHWPIYPRDRDTLIDGLAKLMCTQEYHQRRNLQTRQKRALEESGDSSSDISSDESDSEQSEIFYRFSRHPITGGKTQEERNAINLQKARENIEIHLDFIYPLDGAAEEIASAWLFNGDNWPKDSKRFAWRYFHEYNLYTNKKNNSESLLLFTDALKFHLDIDCTEVENAAVRKRCTRQVAYAANIWSRKYGFLEEVHGILRKTVQFDAAWRQRRQLWIDQVHKGDPPVEFKPQRSHASLPNASEVSVGSKRAHAQVEDMFDIYDVPLDDVPSGSAAKRSRTKAFESNPLNGSSTTNNEGDTFDTALLIDETTIAVDAEGIRSRRAPEAPMTSLPPGQSQSHLRPVQPEHAQKDSTARQPPTSGHNLPHISQGATSLPSASAQARKDTKVSGGWNILKPLEERRTPYALSGGSLNIPFSTDTAVVQVSRTAAPAKPAKPPLHYIVPNSTGALDFDAPLPRSEFVDSKTLSEFFRTVARRAGKPDEPFSCLTFTYNWGGREAFVVKRYGGDQYWEEIKERVKGAFMKARNSMPKKTTRFELWIECGDTTNIDEVEEEDDW